MTIQAGTVIENPVIGDRLVLLDTSAETGGELLRFDLFARPGAPGPPEHVHPEQEERFAVISGTLRGRIDGEEREFSAGDKFVVPAGIPHTWWNDGDAEVQVRVELRPASRMASFLETLYGLAQDGKTNEEGVPNLLQLAVIAREYFDVNHVAHPPLAVQKLAFSILAPLGRLMGYRADYPYPYDRTVGDGGIKNGDAAQVRNLPES